MGARWFEPATAGRPREPDAISVELLRVDPDTGHVTELGLVAAGGPGVRVSLALDHEDALVIAVSRTFPTFTRFARLRVEGNEVIRLGWSLRLGQRLVGDVGANRWGVHYLTERPNGYRTRALPWTAFAATHGGDPLCP